MLPVSAWAGKLWRGQLPWSQEGAPYNSGWQGVGRTTAYGTRCDVIVDFSQLDSFSQGWLSLALGTAFVNVRLWAQATTQAVYLAGWQLNPYVAPYATALAVGQIAGTCQQTPSGLQFVIFGSGLAGTTWGVDAAFAFIPGHPLVTTPSLTTMVVTHRVHGREL